MANIPHPVSTPTGSLQFAGGSSACELSGGPRAPSAVGAAASGHWKRGRGGLPVGASTYLRSFLCSFRPRKKGRKFRMGSTTSTAYGPSCPGQGVRMQCVSVSEHPCYLKTGLTSWRVSSQKTAKPNSGRRKDLFSLAASKENHQGSFQSSVSPKSKIGEVLR